MLLVLLLVPLACDTSPGGKRERDRSGVYCLNLQNMEMTIAQTGNSVAFALQEDLLTDGTGTAMGDIMILTANLSGSAETFAAILIFSRNGKSFEGPYRITDPEGQVTLEGMLFGNKGECAKQDIETHGVPRFVGKDFTQLDKIEMISRFRSGFGHSYTDSNETCRSMKHYYTPYEQYRENDTVEIYSPVKGTIMSVSNDGHGASIGLKNKQIQIRPDAQPAFIFVIFHCDLISTDIEDGRRVAAGELLGHARLYYEDLDEHATSFDISVWVSTPDGPRLVPYFDTLADGVFEAYESRGVPSREAFTITREERDANPLECDGETFLSEGTLENWVPLD